MPEDDLTKRQLELEERKILVEEQKVSVEREKIRWAALSAIVPVVVALGTIIYGVWSLSETAKTQFETKLVEVAMQGPGPIEAINRAKLVSKIFSEYVPKDFDKRLRQINPSDVGNDNVVDSKKELLRLLADHPADRSAIIATWRSLFPGDQWITDLTK